MQTFDCFINKVDVHIKTKEELTLLIQQAREYLDDLIAKKQN